MTERTRSRTTTVRGSRVLQTLDQLLRDPKATAETIEARVDQAQIEKGQKSQQRAIELIKTIPSVSKIQPADVSESQNFKYHFKVEFVPQRNLDPIPVRVRTSVTAAEYVKTIERKNKRRIIVLAAGDQMTDEGILDSFKAQLNYLENLI